MALQIFMERKLDILKTQWYNKGGNRKWKH